MLTSSLLSAPGPPSDIQCTSTVVVWREPESPNGKITGYSVRFSRGSNRRQVSPPKPANEPYHVIRTSDLPTGSAALTVQVREIMS